MLIKTMKLRLDELALYVIFDFGGFLFGSLLLMLITYFQSSEPDYTAFRMGTVMAWIVFCFVSVMVGMFSMTGYFNWHVGFGKTRKSFFICDIITELCWNLLNVVVIWGLSIAEGGILKLFYGSYREGAKELWGMWLVWMLPVFAIALTVVRELTGTLVMHFGKKVFWIMWGLWMFVCLVPGKIDADKKGAIAKMAGRIKVWMSGMSITDWTITGIVLVLLMLIVSWLLMRKQAVES